MNTAEIFPISKFISNLFAAISFNALTIALQRVIVRLRPLDLVSKF